MKTTLHLKILFFLLTILLCSKANAQTETVTFGLASRSGIFKTLVSRERANEVDYGIGLQFSFGAWAKFPVSSQGSVQVNVFQVAERQYAGEIQVVNEDRQPITNAKLRHRNLAAILQTIYLHSLGEKWSVGIGAGAKYEFLSRTFVKNIHNVPTTSKNEYTYDNEYRRGLTLLLPLEVQYELSDKFAFVGQAQLQLSNRTNASNYDFREHDLGLNVGVNYTLK